MVGVPDGVRRYRAEAGFRRTPGARHPRVVWIE